MKKQKPKPKQCKTLGVIPVRYNSSRLPGKPLVDIAGLPLVACVYKRAIQSSLDQVIVATDDERIFDVCDAMNIKVVKTSGEHLTGSDRTAEVAKMFDADIVVNIQGDQPLIEPSLIDELVSVAISDKKADIVTAMKLVEVESLNNKKFVSVVCDKQGYALYFSRAKIPASKSGSVQRQFCHLGIYAFKAESLRKFAKLERGKLECQEDLEQLRALENGMKIKVIETNCSAISVDDENDLHLVRGIFAGK